MTWNSVLPVILLMPLVALLLFKAYHRLRLSLAKHPSLTGHSKMSKRLARLLPYYEISAADIFRIDRAPAAIAEQRRVGFFRLAEYFRSISPASIELAESLEDGVSDLEFTNTYRVPFQFARYVKSHLRLGAFVTESSGVMVKDIDDNWSYDLTGSYGVNVFGNDFYKSCIAAAVERVGNLGPVLGTYHPLVAENVEQLQQISGLDEVSFHMSGTEAVMQAVRLARYHTQRSKLVNFCGAYHGWWDGVQAGVGNPRKTHDVITLSEMSQGALDIIRSRRDIACVLINPLQAMNPNIAAPGDSTLVGSSRSTCYDRAAYSRWLSRLRKACDESGVVMIMDEVFVGFRIAPGGAQEYFGVKADMVTYGKTLGGGLPIGVVCGRQHLMKRFREHRPADICFARGTFNSHPYVMAAMNEFLRRIQTPEIRALYASCEDTWNSRCQLMNDRLAAAGLPVRLSNLGSIWTVLYTRPSRYNWMFQYYLRAQGLALSWIGTGRLIFSLNYTAADFDQVMERVVAAATQMEQDGWWWQGPHLTSSFIKRSLAGEFLQALVRSSPRGISG